MSNLVDQLQEDHCNFRRLLDMLEDQATAMKTYTGPGADTRIILLALEYIENYPNLWHHPIENFVFRKLMKKTHTYDALLREIGLEHKTIDHQTIALLAEFNAVIDGFGENNDQLCDQLAAFLSLHRDHLEKEESIIFPAAMKYLDEHDWEDIENSLARHEDPMFGDNAQEQFQSLLDDIMRPEMRSPKDALQDSLWEHESFVH